MKINGFIMANRAQEVPIPIPGTEVTTGISWSYTNPVTYYSARNIKVRTGYEDGTWTRSHNTSYSQYTNWNQYPQCVPAKVGWHQDYYCDVDPDDDLHRRMSSRYVILENVTGQITLNLQNVPAGKYVVVVDHWYGSRSQDLYTNDTRYAIEPTNLVADKSIRQGEHGVVYGEIVGIEKYVDTPIGYSLGNLGGIHLRQRVALTIEEGDTSKVIKYGDSTFGMPLLAQFLHRGYDRQDHVISSFYSAALGLAPRLYKEA